MNALPRVTAVVPPRDFREEMMIPSFSLPLQRLASPPPQLPVLEKTLRTTVAAYPFPKNQTDCQLQVYAYSSVNTRSPLQATAKPHQKTFAGTQRIDESITTMYIATTFMLSTRQPDHGGTCTPPPTTKISRRGHEHAGQPTRFGLTAYGSPPPSLLLPRPPGA